MKTRKLKRKPKAMPGVGCSELLGRPVLSRADLDRCMAADRRGDIGEVRRITESYGLKWIDDQLIETSQMTQRRRLREIQLGIRKKGEYDSLSTILRKRPWLRLGFRLGNKDAEKLTNQQSPPRFSARAPLSIRDGSYRVRPND